MMAGTGGGQATRCSESECLGWGLSACKTSSGHESETWPVPGPQVGGEQSQCVVIRRYSSLSHLPSWCPQSDYPSDDRVIVMNGWCCSTYDWLVTVWHIVMVTSTLHYPPRPRDMLSVKCNLPILTLTKTYLIWSWDTLCRPQAEI